MGMEARTAVRAGVGVRSCGPGQTAERAARAAIRRHAAAKTARNLRDHAVKAKAPASAVKRYLTHRLLPLGADIGMVGCNKLQNIAQIARRYVAFVMRDFATARPRKPYLGRISTRSLDRHMDMNRLESLSGPEEQDIWTESKKTRHTADRPHTRTA